MENRRRQKFKPKTKKNLQNLSIKNINQKLMKQKTIQKSIDFEYFGVC